jgi:chondroitin AC lyase
MIRLRVVSFLVMIILCASTAQSQLPYQQVIGKYKEFLIAQDTTSLDSIKVWINTLNDNGQWTSIDYKDRNTSSWMTTVHLDRIVKISIAYQNRKGALYHNRLAKSALLKATNHWIDLGYKNSNWWYNEIGVPQFWRDILTLNAELWKEGQYKKALSVLGQYKLKHIYTGANLTWSADLALHYGLLTKNDSLINKASKLIADEIKRSNGEGIRADYSYHQHGARLQTHHYGAAFLKENIRLAYELQGSPWEFPPQKIDILKDFLVQGWQWMARGTYITPATIDRAVSRKNFLNQDLTKLLPYLIKMYPEGKDDGLKAMLKVQQGGEQHLNGFKYFPYSDFGALQQKNFSFFLKTISTHTEITERINGENQKGTFLNLGNTYLIRNGREYTNLMPFWDWSKLPGTTNFRSAKSINRLSFVGGLSAGASGLSVMDCETTSDNSRLTASKFWAVHNGKIYCLIADINLTGSQDSLYTTLEQSRLQGNVIVNSKDNVLRSDLKHAKNIKWVNHNGFTYIPLTGADVSLDMGKVNGSWAELSKSGSSDISSEKVFKLVLNHQNITSAAYLVDGISPVDQIQKLLDKPDWRVLKNTKFCQAITFNDGITMISFHQKDQITFGKNSISVSGAALLILDQTTIYASDPLKKGGSLEIELNGNKISVSLPNDGAAVKHTL